MKVCGRRIEQLYSEYKKTGRIPVLKTPGRPKKEITEHTRITVKSYFEQYPMGAVSLEKIIDNTHRIHIPHNTIHKIMANEGLAAREPSKSSRKRPWVRYERTHSNSLWHTDYKLLDDGRWFIGYLDDASRFVTGYGVFEHATTENAMMVLHKAIKEFGKPASIMTDHGSQFYSNESKSCQKGPSQYEQELVRLGIQQIMSGVRHPQTNGKTERFHGELQYRLHRFKGVDELVRWYNYEKPHRSLNWDNLETPARAFKRKMPSVGTTVIDAESGEIYDVS